MCITSRTAVFIILVLTLAACSSENAPAQNPAESREPLESAKDLRLSDLGVQFGRIESYAKNQPLQLETILGQLENFKADAAGTKFIKKAEALAIKARERFSQEAETAYRKVRKEVDKATAEGNARAAVALLEEYPAEFRSTEWQEKIDAAIAPLKDQADAIRKMEVLRELVKERLGEKNPEAALELVKEYPVSMRKGPCKTEWEKLHSDLSAKVETLKEKRRKEEALPWEELFTGEDMNEWEVQTGDWKLEDGCIVCKYDGSAHAFISCGSEESAWDNFILELEFKIVSGEFLVLGVRGKNVSGHSEFDQIGFTPEIFPGDKFHQVTVEARGNLFTVREGSKVIDTQDANANYTKGFLGFFILPGSEVHIRKVRLKHLK